MKSTKKIAFIQFTVAAAYPPIMNAGRLLAEEGAKVVFWGVGAFGQANQLRNDLDLGMKETLLPYRNPGVGQKLHYIYFLVSSALRAIVWRADYVYVSDLLAFPVGLLLTYVPGAKVIAHEHDTPKETGSLIDRLLHWTRRKLFRRADLTVVPQTQRAELVRNAIGPRNLQVVWNCPRVEEIVTKSLLDSPEIVLWYHGSIVPGQFPREAVASLAHLPHNFRLRFAGYETIGQQGYIANLFDLAKSLGVEDRVEYVGTKPTRSELFEEASKADVGLALFARNFREAMVGASNKPFDYLACGLAVLTNDTEEWTSFFDNCPSVVACDPASPHSIAEKITELTQNCGQFTLVRQAGVRKVRTEWNYQLQFSPVLNLILAK